MLVGHTSQTKKTSLCNRLTDKIVCCKKEVRFIWESGDQGYAVQFLLSGPYLLYPEFGSPEKEVRNHYKITRALLHHLETIQKSLLSKKF